MLRAQQSNGDLGGIAQVDSGHRRTTQQAMPPKWYLLSVRCRNTTEKSAANSISAPRIIWYTDAVTDSRPMFMSTCVQARR